MRRKIRKPVRKLRTRIKVKRQRGKSERHNRRRIKIRRPGGTPPKRRELSAQAHALRAAGIVRRGGPMKRGNRKLSKKRKVQRKKNSRATQPKKRPRKQQRAPQNKSRSLRKPNLPTDPRVARGLGVMRREGVSASEAARRERMKLATFRKGAGRFLYRSGPGKPWEARDEDQLSFSMEVLTRQGRISAITRDSRERKLFHEYELVLRMFRGAEEEAEEELKRFKGKTVGGYELITDPKVLIELEEADEIDVENFYSPVKGQS
jgi:hypothetical protein